MRERGMIFNGEMVRAILDGRKTQTRRPVKFPHIDRDAMCELSGNELAGELSAGNYRNCPHGKPGDRIWVRETWGVVSHELDEDGRIQPWEPDRPATSIHEMPFGNGYYSGHAIYAADGGFTWGDDDGYEDGRSCWKASIHMPRAASRITLEITGVRVEQLRDLSEEDAKSEGVSPAGGVLSGWEHRINFRELWMSIYGSDNWEANPWVWVIEFKRIEERAA